MQWSTQFLSVTLIGTGKYISSWCRGDGTALEHKEEERRKSKIKDERSYNPNGAVQILGHGDLSDEEQLPLSEEEKGRL